MRKVAFFYANEEQAFEYARTVFNENKALFNTIELDITDDLDFLPDQESVIKNFLNNLKEGLHTDGYAFVEYENAGGYEIILGIAYLDKETEITDMLKRRRKQITDLFEKKQYALVCLNEDSTVVSVSIHNGKESARKKMEADYNNTITMQVDMNNDEVCPIQSSSIDSDRAEVIISDNDAYYWQIVEVD